MENTQDYQDYQDYRAEILGIVRSNASPGIMRNKLEDYHENDLADVFPDLSVAERRKLCRILNLDMLADIFEYIDEKQAAEYLDEMDVRKAAAILSRMETDAVVDVLRMIPKEKRALLLELMDDEDILEAGIQIISQPPGKKLQNMMQMSGGEKALTAIALLFAIQNLKPSPFCLLDEIEAALDDSNVDRYAKYLHKLTKHTQFIVITHRRGTMVAADRLYGITMQEKGVSTLVSVNLIENDLK